MRARVGTVLMTVAFVVAAGCGSSAPRAASPPTAPTTTSAHATDTIFCQSWHDAFVTQRENTWRAALRDPPREIADAAEVLRTADENASTPETDAAVKRVSDWIAVNCPTESGRHVAPPAGTDLAGLTACSVLSVPQLQETATEGEHAALYGEAASAEPYDGPMLGVFTAKGHYGGTFAGDGDRTPLTVRGRPGWAAPITVFQQSIVPELGTVIAWSEHGRDVGLYGRLWGKDRIPELVALANRVQEVDGKFFLPPDALPKGYTSVFTGAPDPSWSLVGSTLFGEYTVSYQRGIGDTVYVTGWQSTLEAYNGSRFFALPLAEQRIGDHTGFFGSAWSKDEGPWVATWRDADGFTLRVAGLGASRGDVLVVAQQSRDLDHAEWARVVSTVKGCAAPVP